MNNDIFAIVQVINVAQLIFPQVQGQYQVIPAYYDQNGSIVMGGVRGLSSAATPMRLVSPAPVLVNRAPSQPPPGPPAPPPPNLYSQPTPTSHSNATPGECLGESNGKSSLPYYHRPLCKHTCKKSCKVVLCVTSCKDTSSPPPFFPLPPPLVV